MSSQHPDTKLPSLREQLAGPDMVCSVPIQGAAAERSLMDTGAGGTSDVAITPLLNTD